MWASITKAGRDRDEASFRADQFVPYYDRTQCVNSRKKKRKEKTKATGEEEGGDNEMEPLIHFHGRL
ncbi:hypothetical protein NC651_030864 [Populus alba x Populus x berolinensis]|nr:hypothetical protein NC651_030864 [Populus alba x Populus x berolinensis]